MPNYERGTPEYKAYNQGKKKGKKGNDIYSQMGNLGLLIKTLQKTLGYKTDGK